MGSAFPAAPSLSPTKRVRSDAQFYAETEVYSGKQTRADVVTRYYFYAFMVLDVLGLAAAGYAILTM